MFVLGSPKVTHITISLNEKCENVCATPLLPYITKGVFKSVQVRGSSKCIEWGPSLVNEGSQSM